MSHTLGFLRSSNPFSKLKGTVFEELAPRLRLLKLAKGDVVYRAGDSSPHAYFVYRGVIQLTMPDADGREVELGLVRKDGVHGHSSMLTDTPRVATATAVENCELIEIGRDDFLIVLERWRLSDIEKGS
jgi:CRP/FNR family transcriptional regulator, cyclic AMP receptor protein